MASNSSRRSGSSGRSTPRKRVVIGASETTRVRYSKGKPEVDSERKSAPSGRTRKGPSGRPLAGQAFSRTKREERERRQKMARAKLFGIWAAGAAVVAALAFGVAALYNSQAFAVEQVVVHGQSRLTRDEVMRLAAVNPSATLLRLDTRSVAGRLTSSPWIAAASVRRVFPATLSIDISERSPGALVYVGKTPWLVASDGTWITKVRRAVDVTPTPVVVRDVGDLAPETGKRTDSPLLQNALGVVTGLTPALAANTRVVTGPEIDKTTLLTKSGVEVLIGRAEEMDKKDKIIERILTEQRDKVVYVNVRTTDRPTWRGLEQTP